jgi:two-component system, OmpR family, response regulator
VPSPVIPEGGAAVPLRVLVVDDNRDAADSLALLFEMLGVAVRVAYGGDDALREAAEFRPHVGLFDIDMPGMSGLELARRVRGVLAGRPLFLVAVTGVSDPTARERSAAAGFDLHLTKPADGIELSSQMLGFWRANFPREL